MSTVIQRTVGEKERSSETSKKGIGKVETMKMVIMTAAAMAMVMMTAAAMAMVMAMTTCTSCGCGGGAHARLDLCTFVRTWTREYTWARQWGGRRG